MGGGSIKLYLAGAELPEHPRLLKEAGVASILLSFFSIDEKRLPEYEDFDIFLDSGGFSARVSGKEIDLNKYIDFLVKYEGKFNIYANLDTSSPEETIKNQEFMEAQGLKPIPVYHWSEFISKDYHDLFEEYCKKYDYVAIGGVAGVVKNTKNKFNYLSFCDRIANRYHTKIHGFGITDRFSLEFFNFYSVDSTNWAQHGWQPRIWQFVRGRMLSYDKAGFYKKTGRVINRGEEELRYNILQWKLYADYLEEKSNENKRDKTK